MTEHRKISRVLQLISRLRQPFGYEKEQLAEIFEVNVRTIERYIVLLRDLGFQVVQDNKRLKIELLDKHSFRQEDLIVFTLEEAAVIKEALLGYKMEGPLKHSLLDKLYSLTDLDQLAETMTNLQQARTISTINKAIKLKRQVILQNYDSVAHEPCDRLVEPIRFHTYFKYLTAFEVSSQMIKNFKTDRMTDAQLSRKYWRHEAKHQKIGVDAFGLSGESVINVKLKLKERAWHLLIEEHPETRYKIQKKDSIFIYQDEVYGLEGIGRFVMGLLDEVEVLEPLELGEYVREKVEKWVGGWKV